MYISIGIDQMSFKIQAYKTSTKNPMLCSPNQYICSLICSNIKLFIKAGKDAWTSDLKCCNCVVCPAEGNLFFNN